MSTSILIYKVNEQIIYRQRKRLEAGNLNDKLNSYLLKVVAEETEEENLQ
jgi:hypothetical protein